MNYKSIIGILMVMCWMLSSHAYSASDSLGSAEGYLILGTDFGSGGGGNIYTGGNVGSKTLNYDYDGIFFTSRAPSVTDGSYISDESVVQKAIEDATLFSNHLAGLPVDATFDTSSSTATLTLAKSGLNVITVTNQLPSVIVGDIDNVAILNVLGTRVYLRGNVSGGMLPKNLIVNYVNASEVISSGGSRVFDGTHLVMSGLFGWGAGSGGLNGALITSGGFYLGGGSNTFTYNGFTGQLPSNDSDGDGILDVTDNCVNSPNPNQADSDGDGLGNVCDLDDDNDSVVDSADNCPLVANLDQSNTDNDAFGDLCDDDLDGDGYDNNNDNCTFVENTSQNDIDGDGIGDVCDDDIDGDGVTNGEDVCESTPLGDVVDTGTGCSIAQLCPCDAPRGTTTVWRNHGKYVSCVAKTAENFLNLGLISNAAKDAVVSSAAQSTCGDKN